MHGAFVSDAEVKRVIQGVKKQGEPEYDAKIIEMCERALQEDESSSSSEGQADEFDPMYDQAVQLVIEKGQASTSMVQRALRIGYNRAARIIDCMEREGVVGPMDGAKPREVLVGRAE